MKKIVLTCLLAAAALVTANAQRSIWQEGFGDRSYVNKWTENQELKATIMGEGVLTLGNKNLKAISTGGKILSDSFSEGDSWVFTQPVGKLKKNTYVEFDFCFLSNPGSPKYYSVEILDNGKWTTPIEPQRTASEDGKLQYSFQATCSGTGGGEEPKNVLRTFLLKKGAKDNITIRIVAVGPYTGKTGENLGSSTGFTADNNMSAFINVLGTDKPKDRHKVLCIGNSFTYYFGASFMLKEIAWSMGHYLYVVDALKGGQTFGQHLKLSVTNEAIDQGSYDFAFLQNQSKANFNYGKDPVKNENNVKDGGTIANRIREKSPSCDIIHENTWRGKKDKPEEAIPYMQKGAEAYAKSEGARISPIADAFEAVLTERPDIDMHFTDGHHPSANGAYLKACVNYLMLGIDNEDFVERASDCYIDAETAKYLRSVAVKTVNK